MQACFHSTAALICTALLCLWGCNRVQPQTATPALPEVEVSRPVKEVISDYEEFPGRIVAVKTVDVRARVQGYLEKVLFKEGAEVKQEEPLFIIDRRMYQAEYDRALANLTQAKAHLTRTAADFKRAQELLPEHVIAQSDYDLAKGDRDEADGLVEVAEAALHTAKLNLDWTIVTAPISGRISNQRVDPGNLVLADNTLLTTIVSLDPVYVYFDVDERTSLRIRRQISAGKVKSAREAKVNVILGLADEEPNFPHPGTIDFIDNSVDPMTGTLRLRGVFPNSQRILLPGNFARVRTPVGDPHEAIMVAEKALGSDQGERFLYVVNKKKNDKREVEYRVEYRHVETGALREGLRVISQGLAGGELVVTSGLQRIKRGDAVTPQEVKMPASGQAPAAAKAAPAVKPVAEARGESTISAPRPAKPKSIAKPAAASPSKRSR